jgi:hypothetical protein
MDSQVGVVVVVLVILRLVEVQDFKEVEEVTRRIKMLQGAVEEAWEEMEEAQMGVRDETQALEGSTEVQVSNILLQELLCFMLEGVVVLERMLQEALGVQEVAEQEDKMSTELLEQMASVAGVEMVRMGVQVWLFFVDICPFSKSPLKCVYPMKRLSHKQQAF